jgi:hypothetical protein
LLDLATIFFFLGQHPPAPPVPVVSGRSHHSQQQTHSQSHPNKQYTIEAQYCKAKYAATKLRVQTAVSTLCNLTNQALHPRPPASFPPSIHPPLQPTPILPCLRFTTILSPFTSLFGVCVRRRPLSYTKNRNN